MYEKRVQYYFEVCSEGLLTEGVIIGDRPYMKIEESRKNGQEDTHMSGFVVRTDTGWEWDEDEDGSHMFDVYHSKRLSSEIIRYLNENEPPERKI